MIKRLLDCMCVLPSIFLAPRVVQGLSKVAVGLGFGLGLASWAPGGDKRRLVTGGVWLQAAFVYKRRLFSSFLQAASRYKRRLVTSGV